MWVGGKNKQYAGSQALLDSSNGSMLPKNVTELGYPTITTIDYSLGSTTSSPKTHNTRRRGPRTHDRTPPTATRYRQWEYARTPR